MMQKKKVVAWWLIIGVIMLMIQVLLGGITRLTGSGLSITEWKPLMGALPPRHESEWLLLFEKYKQIAQFKYLNQDFTLSDFKFIFFWEWFHRNWARFISVVFIVPFIYFIVKKFITRDMIPKLIGLFLLGLGQGLIGWIMVASGLNDENVYVSHIRLAVHFVSALILIAFTYWFALSLLINDQEVAVSNKLKQWTIAILFLLTLQLVYGAFMAGLKIATVAPTWPTINGDFIPSTLGQQNIFHHPIAIHFIHRTLAYILTILIAIWYWKARNVNTSKLFNRYRIVPPLLLVMQLFFGILSVLNANQKARNGFELFEYLALFHQAIAMCLVMSFVWTLYLLRKYIVT